MTDMAEEVDMKFLALKGLKLCEQDDRGVAMLGFPIFQGRQAIEGIFTSMLA